MPVSLNAKTDARGESKPKNGNPKSEGEQNERGENEGVEARTGTRDESYDLVSVLYHALRSAETLGQYISDAKQAEDEELASFFEKVRKNDVSTAQRARTLLADRIERGSDEEDEEGEIDDEGDRVAVTPD